MNQATSPKDPSEPANTAGRLLIRLAVYTVLAFGFDVLFYKLLLNKMWLVPVLAEVVLIKSGWTTAAFWKGILARFVGLAGANALTYFVYILPVIYEGREPWSEEVLWCYVTVAVQTPIAGIALIIGRWISRRKTDNPALNGGRLKDNH